MAQAGDMGDLRRIGGSERRSEPAPWEYCPTERGESAPSHLGIDQNRAHQLSVMHEDKKESINSETTV